MLFAAEALAAVCAVMFIRRIKPELAPAAVAIAGCLLMAPVLELMSPVIRALDDISNTAGLGGFFPLLLKALAAAIGCEMCAELCRDCGEPSLAGRVELAGKAYILLLSLPLVTSLLEMTKGLLS